MMNPADRELSSVLSRITNKLQQDWIVSETLHVLRERLNVDRMVLYYFYTQWKGQVTFESVSDQTYSIIGSTGPDDCFNAGYASLYLGGRVQGINDIEEAPINECHRDFLKTMQVRSSLVAPVLTKGKLWGLLVAHHCQSLKLWQAADMESIRECSERLGSAPSIVNS